VQKQVAQIQAQAAMAGKSRETLAKEREKELREKEKADEEKRRKEEAELFKPVQTAQKVPFGVDPKTVLCEFFKVGRCEKGNKCKFSHDRDVGRRVEKRNLYGDAREDKLTGASRVVVDGFSGVESEMVTDTMDKWDEEKLRSVIISKHGNPRTTTEVQFPSFILSPP
jgi:Zinc finger C-x8-C-x5-C-x3-H type (and similar)